VAARVSQVDLMPTILSLLGIGLPPDLDGVDLTGPPDPDRPVRTETVEGRASFGWARLAALYRGPLKYVESPHPELYDLRSDPLERNDLLDSRAGDAAAMRRQLRALEGAAADALAAPADLLETGDVERLAALGYVVMGGRAVDAEEQGPDPKEMLPLLVRLQSLLSDFQSYQRWPAWKRFLVSVTGSSPASSRPELVREFEKVAAEHPDFAPVYQFLAAFYRLEQRPEDAARAIDRQNLLRRIASPRHEQGTVR
jgi:hypothetical protein